MINTLDNHKKKICWDKDFAPDTGDLHRSNLQKIAGKPLDKLSGEKYPGLLIFPPKWDLGVSGKSDIIFDLAGDNLITGNVMGFIGIDETRVRISSRFCPGGRDFFLHYMLSRICGVNVVDLNFTRDPKESLHDFLPYMFPLLLRDALSQGPFKKYRHFEYNDASVRGTIDVRRHIRLNVPFEGKVAYKTREYSYDNAVTQLIRHTAEHLQTQKAFAGILTKDAETRGYVSQIKYNTPSYCKNGLQKVLRANLQPVSHPYFLKYRPLQKLCLQILRREKTNFVGKSKIYGLLFDGAWLWEEYVNTLIGKKFIHPRNRGSGTLSAGGRQYLFWQNGKRKVRIYPDFISADPNNRKIADAKYKLVDKGNNADYFQLLAYMFRFDAPKGFLIYPESAEDIGNAGAREIDEYELLEGASFAREKKWTSAKTKRRENDRITTMTHVCLTIPQDAKSFSEFEKGIKPGESNLKRVMGLE